jgi:hypothetical protein
VHYTSPSSLPLTPSYRLIYQNVNDTQMEYPKPTIERVTLRAVNSKQIVDGGLVPFYFGSLSVLSFFNFAFLFFFL